MSEHKSNVEIEGGSPRGFGIVFSIVFLIIGLWPLLSGRAPSIVFIAIAAIFLLVAVVAPKVFTVPNKWWMKFGLLLGAIIAPIVMGVVYLFTIVPTGLIMRLRGKDLLGLELDSAKSTYWIDREDSAQSMKNQF